MIITLRPVFNLFSQPHYAVVANLPADLGGGENVIDLFSQNDLDEALCSPARLLAEFQQQAQLLPYRRNPHGLTVDALRIDEDGIARRQCTIYLPEMDGLGKSCVDALADWVCSRTRISLTGQIDRTIVTPEQQDRILNSHADKAPVLQLVA